jgi:hypothetical protein
MKVRVGALNVRAIWVSAEELGFDDGSAPP